MTERENWLRTHTFTGPDRIPFRFGPSVAAWKHYRGELEALMLHHKALFPDFQKGDVDWDNMEIISRDKAGIRHTDDWGCVWETSEDGICGVVTEHPLANWDALDSLVPPDPAHVVDPASRTRWEHVTPVLQQRRREKEEVVDGGLEHGFLFLRLTYLRGFENLLLDMADHHPLLGRLVEMIEAFSREVLRRYLDIGVDMMCFPEDLGAQESALLSPALFREYIRPVYTRLMAPAKKQKVLVHVHSDGSLFDLIDDILACGVDVINLQDLVHGVDELAKTLKGRVSIDLDVDRQDVTCFGTPNDVRALIREEVMELGSPEGGLSLVYGLYPGTPLRNVDALLEAVEEYRYFYS